MSNVLDPTTQQQVLSLGRLGWSLRRIEQTLGVRRETVSNYLKAAGIPVHGRGRRGESKPKPAISERPVSTDSGPPNPATRAEVSTDLAPVLQPGRAPSASACEPHRELIERALERGRNAMAIWQDLVDTYGFEARYSSVRRFVRTLRPTAAEPHAVITTAPGEESQVDYGDGPMVRHPVSGQYRRTRLFVLTLGYSRKSVRLLVWHSSAQVWAELHERAFRRLGGTTRVVVLDNLKEGVLTPDIYEPALNPLYRDVLAHYGVVALPCRVGDADMRLKEQALARTTPTNVKPGRYRPPDKLLAFLERL
jgi:transposase